MLVIQIRRRPVREAKSCARPIRQEAPTAQTAPNPNDAPTIPPIQEAKRWVMNPSGSLGLTQPLTQDARKRKDETRDQIPRRVEVRTRRFKPFPACDAAGAASGRVSTAASARLWSQLSAR